MKRGHRMLVRRIETKIGEVPVRWKKGQSAKEAIEAALQEAKAMGEEWPVDSVEWEVEPIGGGD